MYESIIVFVNTSPAFKNSLSLSKASNAISRPGATVGRRASSSRDIANKSLSIAGPGSILFLIPSSPAIIIAENAKYGLAVESGNLTSIRLALSDITYGILIEADLFLAE